MTEQQQIGVRLDADLYRRLKILAAEREVRVGELIEEGIRYILAKYGRSQRNR